MEVVVSVLPGALPALRREVERAGLVAGPEPAPGEGPAEELRLDLPRTPESLRALSRLRTAVAASVVVPAPTPRPTGLLSSEAIALFDEALEAIAWQRPRVRFTGLRLEAAGADTPQMQRIAAELAARAGVPVSEEGDLVVRIRRSPPGGSPPGGSPPGGWEALVRTTPRPLATRTWRTERYPGALNATLAAAVVDELRSIREGVTSDREGVTSIREGATPVPEGVTSDRGLVVVDLMCGSGTLTLELLARGPVARMVAVDVSADALRVLQAHQRTSRIKGRIETVRADVADVARAAGLAGNHGAPHPPQTTRPLADLAGTADIVMANPPWGELLGEHESNERHYSELLDAADRIGAPGVVVGILTHDIRRFERVLAADARWRLLARPQFFAKGHRPRLFVLARA